MRITVHGFIRSIHVYMYIAGSNEFVPQNPKLCECVNAELTFNCTIIGSGTTVWRGTSFNCPDRANEITLRHSNFLGSSEMCNMGGIMGSALAVENNNCYTSQLTVTTQAELNNETIICSHISSSGLVVIGSTRLIVISGENAQCIRYVYHSIIVSRFEKRAHFIQNANFWHFSTCHHIKPTRALDKSDLLLRVWLSSCPKH